MKSIFSKEQVEAAYKLPVNFPINEFNHELIVTFHTLADYFTQDEWNHVRYEFMFNVLKSFASSDYFIGLDSKERVDMMSCWENLRYIIEVLRDLFTDNVNENSSALYKYLEQTFLPNGLPAGKV